MQDDLVKIHLACDHTAVTLKNILADYIVRKYRNCLIRDLGHYNTTAVDYPDYVNKAVMRLALTENSYAILLCGSGIGMSIVANRYRGIRAALCYSPQIASLSRLHNNANILCLGARFISGFSACEIVDVFLTSKFSEGRHRLRVQKIEMYKCF